MIYSRKFDARHYFESTAVVDHSATFMQIFGLEQKFRIFSNYKAVDHIEVYRTSNQRKAKT